MPDRHGFDLLGNKYSCIFCNTKDFIWNLSDALREEHSLLHVEPKEVIFQTIECEDCGELFQRESKRGRQPKYCPTCRLKYAPIRQQEGFSEADNDKPKRSITCAICSVIFEHIVRGRGRPPTKCLKCRGDR